MPQRGTGGGEEQEKPPLKTTGSQSIGTVSIRLMRIIYFANVSSVSSWGQSLLDTDNSQFSDSRLTRVFFFLPYPLVLFKSLPFVT